jgi:hypothetical protein
MAVSKRRGKKSIMNGTASARDTESSQELWREIEQALRDPEMIDEGDPPPSDEAAVTLKGIITKTQGRLGSPIPLPHIEFVDGSIRLVWTKPTAIVILVVASSADRRSYVYHARIENGQAAAHGTVEPTPSNLAHWLSAMEPKGHVAYS